MESLSETLSALIGARLVGIFRGDLHIDGKLNEEDLGPLELQFEDGRTLQTWLADDGQSLEVNLFPSAPPDLNGQGGPWPRIDLSLHAPYLSLLRQEVAAVRYLCFGVRGERTEALAGLEFHFRSGMSLTYFNAGDFAKIYVNERPPDLSEPFYLRVSPVPPDS